MHKKIGRKICTILLTIAVGAASLAGCSGTASAKDKTSAAKIDPETVFEEIPSPMDSILDKTAPEASAGSSAAEEEALPDDDMSMAGWNINSITAQNGRYYVMYTGYDGGSPRLCSFDAQGENAQNFTIPVPGDGWGNSLSVSPDGRVYVMAGSYDDKTQEISWKLHAFTLPQKDGGEMKEDWSGTISRDEDFYPSGMVSTDDTTAVLSVDSILLFNNQDGKQRQKVSLSGSDSYQKVFSSPAGDLIVTGSGDKGATAWKLDSTGKLIESPIQAEGFYYFDATASGSGSYDYYAAREDGVYGCTLGADPVRIIDLVASDLDISSIQSLAVLSPESALILHYGEEELVPVLVRKADASGLADKTILTLGCSYTSDEIRRAVIQFNKSNTKFRIAIREYPYDDEGHSRLNTEIASGNIPDLIFVTPDLPVESYAAKGMFEDLEPMFTGDPDISKTRFLDNILDAFRIDGKMYFVTPAFNVVGLMGKKKDFKDTKGVTIRQLEKMISDRGLSYDTALGLVSRDSILTLVMYFAQDQYVDWDKNECSFDSDSFVSLLEFAKKFPKEINYEKIDWEACDANMRTGKQLVRDVYLSSFESYMYERYGYIGEETTYMGYPGNGDNGPAVSDNFSIAMSHSAVDREACWQFMRTFYLEPFQTSLEYSFPVSRKALEAAADKAMHPRAYTYTDENGEEITETPGSSVYLNGKEVGIPVPSQKDIDEVTGILENVRSRASIDTNISAIITEEADAFFAGQKSAAETADVIQSRVRVYLGEIR